MRKYNYCELNKREYSLSAVMLVVLFLTLMISITAISLNTSDNNIVASAYTNYVPIVDRETLAPYTYGPVASYSTSFIPNYPNNTYNFDIYDYQQYVNYPTAKNYELTDNFIERFFLHLPKDAYLWYGPKYKITTNISTDCSLGLIYIPRSNINSEPKIQYRYYDSNNNYIDSYLSEVVQRGSTNAVNTMNWIQVRPSALVSPAPAYYTISVLGSTYGVCTLCSVIIHSTSVYQNIRIYNASTITMNSIYGLSNEPYWEQQYIQTNQALELAQNGATLEGTLDTLTTAPINALKDLLSLEVDVLGLDLTQIILILLTLGVVGFVIKILIAKG